MRILTLDDTEVRQAQFRSWFASHVHDEETTAGGAIELLENFSYDIVMLDHDLAEEHYLTLSEGLHEARQPGMPEYSPGTGMDVVDFLVANPDRRPSYVIVHSWNPGRAMEMHRRLYENGFKVLSVPFGKHLQHLIAGIVPQGDK